MQIMEVIYIQSSERTARGSVGDVPTENGDEKRSTGSGVQQDCGAATAIRRRKRPIVLEIIGKLYISTFLGILVFPILTGL
jgi:hypothetical protein